MNLTLYFRLILISIFQQSSLKNYDGEPLSYDRYYFFSPKVYAKDGWSISLQIHSGNYCSSERGYRELGHTMEKVEWGFSSEHEPLLINSMDGGEGSATDNVGSISIEEIETILEKHGGIDWEATISIEQFKKFVKI